jgi:hypothetical protein
MKHVRQPVHVATGGFGVNAIVLALAKAGNNTKTCTTIHHHKAGTSHTEWWPIKAEHGVASPNLWVWRIRLERKGEETQDIIACGLARKAEQADKNANAMARRMAKDRRDERARKAKLLAVANEADKCAPAVSVTVTDEAPVGFIRVEPIITHMAVTCGQCGNPVPAKVKAKWSPGKGIFHLDCI